MQRKEMTNEEFSKRWVEREIKGLTKLNGLKLKPPRVVKARLSAFADNLYRTPQEHEEVIRKKEQTYPRLTDLPKDERSPFNGDAFGAELLLRVIANVGQRRFDSHARRARRFLLSLPIKTGGYDGK